MDNFDLKKYLIESKATKQSLEENTPINEFYSESHVYDKNFNKAFNDIYKLSVKWAASRDFDGFDNKFKQELHSILSNYGLSMLDKGESLTKDEINFISKN